MGKEWFSRDFLPDSIWHVNKHMGFMLLPRGRHQQLHLLHTTPHLTPALSRAEQISYMKMGSAWRHWPLRSCWQHRYVKLVFGLRATEPSAGALQKPWCCMHRLGTTKPVHLLWRHKWPWDMLANNMLCECSHSKTRAVAAHSSTSVSSQ